MFWYFDIKELIKSIQYLTWTNNHTPKQWEVDSFSETMLISQGWSIWPECLTLISNRSLVNQDLRDIQKKYYGWNTLRILFVSLCIKAWLAQKSTCVPCNTAGAYYCTSIQCTESCDLQKDKCIRDVNY